MAWLLCFLLCGAVAAFVWGKASAASTPSQPGMVDETWPAARTSEADLPHWKLWFKAVWIWLLYGIALAFGAAAAYFLHQFYLIVR
jgi:hypothetical protein